MKYPPDERGFLRFNLVMGPSFFMFHIDVSQGHRPSGRKPGFRAAILPALGTFQNLGTLLLGKDAAHI
jgi:hypothetical protein